MTTIQIAIFSYNRPVYLLNCIESVVKHSNMDYVIIDDNSSNKKVANILNQYKEHTIVMKNKGNSINNLYINMINYIMSCKSKYLLMLQDDTQLLRDINKDNIKHID